MTQLYEQLNQLVTAACSHPPGSAQRQRNLTKIIRLVSKKLWQEHSPYYQDALQKTWIYFCQNICEGKTGNPYDSSRGSVVTWLNFYLKKRLQDERINDRDKQSKTVSASKGKNGENLDPINSVAAPPDVPTLLEDIREWVETAAVDSDLRSTHIKGHRELTCQVLILRRLPPETSWKTLSEEFNVSISTLSSFYQRQCLPRLRKFGESEGYL